MENLNDFGIYLSMFALITFTDFVPSVETRFFLGYVLMYVMVFVVLINMASIFYMLLRTVFVRV